MEDSIQLLLLDFQPDLIQANAFRYAQVLQVSANCFLNGALQLIYRMRNQ